MQELKNINIDCKLIEYRIATQLQVLKDNIRDTFSFLHTDKTYLIRVNGECKKVTPYQFSDTGLTVTDEKEVFKVDFSHFINKPDLIDILLEIRSQNEKK